MKKYNKKFLISIGCTILLFGFCSLVYALNTISTGYQSSINNVLINAHGKCFKVKHTGGQSYFIPTKTSGEWLNFRNNKPADITTNLCTEITKISTNFLTSCGIRTDGAALCWGFNGNGQIGDGTTTNRSVPTLVSGGYTFTSISVGVGYTCGLLTNNTVRCWGNNDYGQLGDGTTTSRLTPTLVSGGHIFSVISSTPGSLGSLSHTCGIRNDGAALCWGWNANGQIGDNTTTQRLVPTVVNGGHTFVSINTTGANSTCGLRNDDKVLCWGQNSIGQLGDATTIQKLIPTLTSGNHSFLNVSGGSPVCGVRINGTAMCWGGNNVGQIGDGTTTNRTVPTLVSGGHIFTAISGGTTSCGIRSDQKVLCWGGNGNGTIGDNTTANKSTPTLTSGSHNFIQMSLGGTHNCGVRADGLALCWGNNLHGQIGNNTSGTPNVLIPTITSGGHNFSN